MAEEGLIDFEASLRRRIADLERLNVGFALVGGLAVSIRAEPRLTRDADFAVSVVDDHEAEEVIRRLVADGYIATELVEQESTRRLATARLIHDEDPGVLTDLLFASSGIEPEIVEGAERIEVLPDLMVPVATIGHLIAMKLLARDDRLRPADADDLRALADLADEDAWELARTAVQLIVDRKYNRGRDLVGALDLVRREGPYT